jgi:tetratricopeptide (TPR) repeat protein
VSVLLRAITIACGVPLLAVALAAQSPAARPSGDPSAEATVVLERARELLRDNNVPQAREAAQRAMSLYQQANDEHGVGVVSMLLGETAFRMGDEAEGKARYQRAMAAFEATDDLGDRARSVLGLLRATTAPIADEEILLERAARDAKAAGSKDIEGRVQHSWGDRLFAAGRYEPALER